MSSELEAAKRAARVRARGVRAGCDPGGGAALAAHVLGAGVVPAGVVSGFWPIGDEIDIRPLLMGLHDRGCQVVLPEVVAPGRGLRFRLWVPGEQLVPGRYGTAHTEGPELVPDTLLIPLLAFDRRGGRLGYGGGYYDRSLHALPGRLLIGCAYAAQEVPAVPTGPHDIALHKVATESGVIDCRVIDSP